MVNVGCKFSPNDLSPAQWRDLIALALERDWLREQIDKYREKKKPLNQREEAGLAAARRDAGIPSEGQSLFGKHR